MKKIIKKSLSSISPKLATKILYRKNFGRNLDLNNPLTLNEKLQWLKLNTYYKNELVTICVDKYRVREYLQEKKCEHLLNDLIGVWDSVEDINFTKLPDQFVLKCNHGAGYNIVCKDKNKLNIDVVKKQLNAWLNEDFWKLLAEVNYKFVPKKIIAEKYIETDDGRFPDDYKVYCFNGKPEYIMLCQGREDGATKFYFFDTKWNLKPLNKDSKDAQNNLNIKKPEGLEKLLYYSKKLSEPFPFVRVDFYLEKGEITFGELTFTPAAALDTNRLPETDLLFGKMLKLPQ